MRHCHEGTCLQHPTVKHQPTIYLTNHQRTTCSGLGLSTVAHFAWQTATTEEGLGRGAARREHQSSGPPLRARDLTVVSSCKGKLSAVPENGDLILNCQTDTQKKRNLLQKLKDQIDPKFAPLKRSSKHQIIEPI